ncbi:hypothetical protein [Streptacidiphilus sp. P02-A3a]|uniref:hypothetical protein n=1 Tax=Streptacidiphilus sp. P02-A3a TaxID=2704468 RepID=UPI0015FE6AF6|nr:hypothetical protein [Streptacidiphilus sp. P02-A3a]QMU70599.1 hypothetical protein GXP74_22750 [Streptacidiphilus sp. P02-A3a]
MPEPSSTASTAPWAEPVGVRIAGLPADALDRSRIPLSTGLALRIVALDQESHADAEQISAELYALVATEQARPFKARLVGLRRAVHRGLPVAALLDRAAPPEVVGAALTARIRRHAALRQVRADEFELLERTLLSEVRSAASALAQLAEDPRFGLGLGYASPDLYDDVRRWTERERVEPGRRPLDRAAVRLAKYAARAVAKPSPLTTFAASGLARWSAHQDAAARLTGALPADLVEAGLLPLSRIAATLAHLPELDRAARLRVNPFATLVPSAEGDRWLFTAPGPSGEVRSLPATAALAAILKAAREVGTRSGLRALLGAPADLDDPAAAGRADAVIAQLLRLGLLETQLGLPDQALDADTLSGWLAAHAPDGDPGDRLALVLDDLRVIRDQVDAARRAAPAAHRGIAAGLRSGTTDAARRLGLLGAAESLDLSTPYFHNTVVPGDAATLDPDSWRPVLAELALVPCLLAPFDTLAPRRDALLRQAVSGYGEGFRRPFTLFLRDFGAWWARADAATPVARDAQRQAELRALLAATPEDADGTVRLAPDAVRELCGHWIDRYAADDRYTCYVQPLPATAAGLGVVLNTVTCGHGTGRSRTARMIDAAVGAPTSPALHAERPDRPDRPDRAHYAEFDASFGSSLNQRAAVTRYAIDLDGCCSARPSSDLIRPADLDVVHDPDERRLRLEWRGTGRTVRPLHLGLLATPLLPLPAGLLVEAFGQSSYSFWSDWPQLWRTAADVPGAPRRVARIALGSVVLRRACWFVDGGDAPARAPGEPDSRYLVRVHAWREAHGLPLRCYLRTLTPRPADGYAGPALHDKDRKPVYLDFGHPHLLRIFEQAAASGRPLLLSEPLPELQDAPARPDGQRHTAEFLIELAAAKPTAANPTAASPTTAANPTAQLPPTRERPAAC